MFNIGVIIKSFRYYVPIVLSTKEASTLKLLPCFFKYLKSFHEDLQDSFLSQLKRKKYF